MTTLWETETERLVLVFDEYAERPYDDGSSPIVRIESCRHCAGERAEQETDLTSYRLPGDICDAFHHYSSNECFTGRDAMTLWERYLRIWHGVTTLEQDGDYVTFDPKDWRDAMGSDDARPNINEWRAYLDGDVYVAVLERKVHWTAAETGETRETWETFDAVGGFYGYEWAETGALQYFPEPKPMPCRYCARAIVLDGDIWVDPEATGDDAIWRETCESHDTFTAEHAPVGESA